MELSAPKLRCVKVVSIGPPCMMTSNHLFDATVNVRGTVNTRDAMPLTLNL
jgi:hypothetical protein